MTGRNRIGPARLCGFAVALALGTGGLLLAGAPALADSTGNDGGGGIGISVEVPGPADTGTATPVPAPTPTVPTPAGEADQGGGSSGDQGSGSGDGRTDGGDAGSATGTGSGGAAGSGKRGTGGHSAQDDGPLNVSGLHAEYTPALNPGGGTVVAWFTVHNGSKSAIASRVHFWVTGPVGNVVSDGGTLAVPAIRPGGTVVVRQALGNIGQWTVLTAHAKYTPPGSVDGIVLKALARDVTIFAFPWLNTAGLVLSLTAVSIAAVVKPALFGIFLRRVVP